MAFGITLGIIVDICIAMILYNIKINNNYDVIAFIIIFWIIAGGIVLGLIFAATTATTNSDNWSDSYKLKYLQEHGEIPEGGYPPEAWEEFTKGIAVGIVEIAVEIIVIIFYSLIKFFINFKNWRHQRQIDSVSKKIKKINEMKINANSAVLKETLQRTLNSLIKLKENLILQYNLQEARTTIKDIKNLTDDLNLQKEIDTLESLIELDIQELQKEGV